jgi:DNA-binding IclR family transcriptional regulator
MSQTRPRGVRSVATAMAILDSLARHDGPVTLNALAQDTGIAAAKLHRYLVSLADTGMVHHRHSGSYDLGPLATRVGMAALNRADLVNQTADGLDALVERSGHTAQLSVLGDRGPTIVRWEQAERMVITSLGLGSTLPLLGSATGRIFLAFNPRRRTQSLLARERAQLDDPMDEQAIDALLRETLRAGYAVADQQFIPGLHAVAAPVLNAQNQTEAVVTLVATEAIDSEAVNQLLDFTRRCSGKPDRP